jgi:hypothetical protein
MDAYHVADLNGGRFFFELILHGSLQQIHLSLPPHTFMPMIGRGTRSYPLNLPQNKFNVNHYFETFCIVVEKKTW